MATVRSLLGIICLIICGGFTEPSSNFLKEKTEARKLEGLGIMLCSDQKSLSFAKYERHPIAIGSQLPVKSKKQQYCLATSTAKPQTQWFCVNVFTAFNFSVANKTKCHCFFDAGGFVKRHLRVIDKQFCILLMLQKCEAFLNTYKNINEGEKLEVLRHRANDKNINEGEKLEALRHRANNKLQYSNASPQLTSSTINQQTQRTSVLAIARSQLGIRETTGKNDGAAVESYLNYTGNEKGTPWCASFISWVYGQAGLGQPRTAWSPALFPLSKQTLSPLPADVFGIYFPSLKRIAHCGIVEVTRGNWLQTIEGNTNSTGAREGNGVYRKLRHKRTIAVYANWLNHLKKGEPK